MFLKCPCSYKDTAAGHILTRRKSLSLLTCWGPQVFFNGYRLTNALYFINHTTHEKTIPAALHFCYQLFLCPG